MQQLHSNRGMVFSVQSVPRCCKQDTSVRSQWSGVEWSELVIGYRKRYNLSSDFTEILMVYGSWCPAALGLGFTQPRTEMSTRNIKIIMFLRSKVRLVRKADNLTAICEPIV
jgi:hypothetical protein